MNGPLTFVWDGQAMKPATSYIAKKAAEQFKPGEKIIFEQVFERSPESHRHFFASVHEAWLNLPEKYRLEYPTSEHLRKRALCVTGFHYRTDYPCKSEAEALRAAAMLRTVDEYAVVCIEPGNVVVRLVAKSQRTRAMRNKEFQESKTAVLAYCWQLCGVDPETGEVETGRAA